MGRLIVRIAARLVLKLVFRVVRVIVCKAGGHLKLLARIKVKFHLKLVAPGVGAVKREAVKITKLEAVGVQFRRYVVVLVVLSVD